LKIQGLFERPMGMVPPCKESEFVWVSSWSGWVQGWPSRCLSR